MVINLDIYVTSTIAWAMNYNSCSSSLNINGRITPRNCYEKQKVLYNSTVIYEQNKWVLYNQKICILK